MKFLIDNAISPFVSTQLCQLGFDSVHVREYQMQTASDKEVLERAAVEGGVIISAGTDFALLLSIRKTGLPSVILFRKGAERNPQNQIELLKSNLTSELRKNLEEGAIIIIEESRIRIRKLPLLS